MEDLPQVYRFTELELAHAFRSWKEEADATPQEFATRQEVDEQSSDTYGESSARTLIGFLESNDTWKK